MRSSSGSRSSRWKWSSGSPRVVAVAARGRAKRDCRSEGWPPSMARRSSTRTSRHGLKRRDRSGRQETTTVPFGFSASDRQGATAAAGAVQQIENPRVCGGFRSRPVSRILSWVAISLGRRLRDGSSGVPGSSAGSVVGTCFTLHRTGFGEPPCHHGAGGLLPHPFTLTAGVSGEVCRRWRSPFCATFRRLSPPGVSPASCPAVSGLSSAPEGAAVTRPASPL